MAVWRGSIFPALIAVSRASLDIDTTINAISLTLEQATKVIEEIIAIDLGDNVRFRITKSSDIMEEHEYPGIRFVLEATVDKLRQSIKVDISTGDVITPRAIQYSFPLLFEERAIDLCTYNMETLLAEKIETILSRGSANTRMRDYYDLYILTETPTSVDESILRTALRATCEKRGSLESLNLAEQVLEDVNRSTYMKSNWDNYVRDSFYIDNLPWDAVSKHDAEYILNLLK